MVPIDPAPFFSLQGMVGLGALLTATAVLTKQNRLAQSANVSNRHDPAAAALQQSMNPDLVLAALDERSEADERMKPVGKAKKGGAPP